MNATVGSEYDILADSIRRIDANFCAIWLYERLEVGIMTRRLELGTTKQGVGAGVRCLGWGCRCIKGRDEAISIKNDLELRAIRSG
jgi:hypothetical protein